MFGSGVGSALLPVPSAVFAVWAMNKKQLPYSGKFSRVLIFAVFADQGETAKFYTSKIFN